MKQKNLKPIPDFQSEEEERAFWKTHDTTDYLDWSQAVRVHFPNLKRSHPRERYLSTHEIAIRYQLQPGTIRKWLEEGKLRGIKVGRQWRIKAEDWEVFMAKMNQAVRAEK